MSAEEMDALADGVVEMTARAIGPILGAAAPSGVAVPLASFVTIRRFIDRNLTSPDLGTKKVAVSFGLSRASLYRLFEPVGGLAGYIRKRRLERAYQEITAPDLANRRIGPIAYRLGFKNISAFSRAFRSAYGVSPMEARENALKGVSDAPLQAEAGEGKSLGRWLMQIAET
jgi:AraC-like DNA-binding protein